MRIYRDILKSAWHTLIRNPWLWPLGLLAALAGNGGEYGSLVTSLERISNQGSFLESLRLSLAQDELSGFAVNAVKTLIAAPLEAGSAFILLAAVALGVVWVVTVAQASVIQAAGSIDRGEPATFASTTRRAAGYFWPIFLLNVLAKFATYLILAVAVLPFLISYLARPGADTAFSWLITISFVIFVPLALVISFIIKYAATAVVLEGDRWWQGLQRAVGLFFRNWLVSLEMAAILFGINMVLGLVVFILIPQTISFDIVLLAAQGSLAALLRILPSMVVLLLVGAGFGAFQYSAWTILFRRLVEGNVLPKLVRATSEVPEYLGYLFGANKKRSSAGR